MRILLAFDTDGTFWTDEDESEYICGIIDPIKLEQKQRNYQDIVGIYVVSESPFYPKKIWSNGRISERFNVINDQGSRYHNLLKVRNDFELHGKADIAIYVDDQSIWKKDAEQAGYIFCEVNQFADMFNVRKI